MSTSRRDVLKYAVYGGSAALLPGCLSEERGVGRVAQGSHQESDGCLDRWQYWENCRDATTVPEFTAALPVPPVLAPTTSDATTDYYDITMAETTQQVLPTGSPTTLFTYNGTWPGPTIKARRGRRAVVRQRNNLDLVTTVHLHGAMVAPSSDGHPTDYIQPGATKSYDYPNVQQALTMWYHDHTMDLTGPQVYRGLAGFYLLGDDHEASLNLPSGEYDVPIVIQDRTFDANNQLVYNLNNLDKEGFLGNTYCVNGKPVPYFKVAQHRYRFRILNGSNARVFELRLSNGAAMTQIASDGGLLVAPLNRTSIKIAPAERVEVVIDFRNVPLGTEIRLTDAGSRNVMRFDVDRAATDTSAVPATLNTIERFTAAQAVVTRRISLDGDRDGHWLINGRLYDPARIDFRPKLNTIERWDVENNSGQNHPFHQHLVHFQVLTFNGSTPPAELRGWKDTIALERGDKASLLMKFEGYTGVFVFHCHRIEHEDHRMMAQQEVVP